MTKQTFSILFVDDEAFFRETITRSVRRYFPMVDECSNGKEALALFLQKRHNVVVSDLNMPIMDGIELAKAVKAVSPETAMIFMTARNDAKTLLEAIEIGVDSYLVKPVNLERLIEKISAVFEQVMLGYKLEMATQEAIVANKAKSLFLANMSHEIRTPLNGIMGFAKLLSEAPLDETYHSYAMTISKSADMLLDIIDEVLDFSKIESGNVEISHEVFELKPMVEHVVNLFWAKAKEKDISLDVGMDETLPLLVEGDAMRLRQVLSNLLSNALKFTPQHGNVSLHVTLNTSHEKNATMTFRVSDSGIGIPVEKHASIFKPFIQADLDTTKKYGGTGLGLSICSAIVQMMGGTIAVMSDVGHGSTFSVTLTLPTVSGEAKKAPYEPIGLDAPLPSKTILVAEDNTTNQMLIQILLQKMGMKCLIANDGVEAVKMYQEHEVDMILMDGHMPNLDGVGATKAILELQAHSGLRKVPIVALTASAIKGDREYFLSMGMDDYLSKPITVEALEKVMRIYF